MEVLLESDCKRRPDDVEEDDQGEETVPYFHVERVHVKFVPGHVRLLIRLHITVGVFALGVAVIRVGRYGLVEHLLQLALLHVVPHVVQAAAQEHEQADLAPELPDSLLALVCVHGTKWLVVKFLPTSDGSLYFRLVEHTLNFDVFRLFILLGWPRLENASFAQELVDRVFLRIFLNEGAITVVLYQIVIVTLVVGILLLEVDLCIIVQGTILKKLVAIRLV